MITFLTSGMSSVLGCSPAATLEIVSTSKSFLLKNLNVKVNLRFRGKVYYYNR